MRGRLCFKVAVLLHARHLHHSAQLHLTPLTTSGRLAQGLDQLLGCIFKPLIGLRDMSNLLLEGGIITLSRFVALGDLILHFLERFRNRFNHLLDCKLAFFQLTICLLLLHLQAIFSQ